MYFPDNGVPRKNPVKSLVLSGENVRTFPRSPPGSSVEKPLAGFDVIEPDQVVAEFAAAASVSGREHSAIRSQRSAPASIGADIGSFDGG